MPEDVSAASLVQEHASGRLTCTATMARVFAALPEVQDRLNCFTEWFEGAAMAQARVADDHLASGGDVGALHGVPVTIKDMTPSAGHHTTRGSFTTGAGATDHDALAWPG